MKSDGYINIVQTKTLLIFFVCIAKIAVSHAQDDSGEAAANAANPLAFVTKMQVQPNFTWKENGARIMNFTSRIIQPTASIGLPFIKSKDPSKIYTIYRLEVPIIGQTFPDNKSLDATGLSDLILLDVIVLKKKWGMLGAGPGLIIPTMKPIQISSRKWSSGIAVVVLNTKTKGLQWGGLVQQFFSFAGATDRPNETFMLFQPIVNKIFRGGNFIQFNPIMNFNFTAQTYHVPITLAFGKAFAKNLSASIAPEYVIMGPNKGDVTIRFQLNAMFAK